MVGAFNQEKALVGALSVIVKSDCETDGALHSTTIELGWARPHITMAHHQILSAGIQSPASLLPPAPSISQPHASSRPRRQVSDWSLG